MRRALAAAILGISLWLGSLAWTGFVLTRTVLDPERSRDVAEALYEDDAVRAQLTVNIADGVEAALPEGLDVPRAAIEAGASQALDSPAVEAVFVDAFVQTHAALLGEGEAPSSIDPGAFGAAARESLVAARPELDAVLPATPQLAVSLPTDRVPNLGPVRDVVLAVVPVLALVSAGGALLALVVTSNRPAVIRRAGVWAMGLSAAVLVFAYGIPALASRYAPDQSEIVAALVGAMAESTRIPALTLGAVGLAGVILSFAWRAMPSPALGSRPRASTPVPTRRAPVAPPRRERRDMLRPPRPASAGRPRPPDGYAPGARRAEPPPPPRPPASGAPAPTIVQPSSAPPPTPSAAAPRSDAHWVEGVGWVLDTSASAIPADARWVPGVGYVVDDS